MIILKNIMFIRLLTDFSQNFGSNMDGYWGLKLNIKLPFIQLIQIGSTKKTVCFFNTHLF